MRDRTSKNKQRPQNSAYQKQTSKETAEELLRVEIQENLSSKKPESEKPEAKTVKFVNSPFGVFLLSAIFISALGGGIQLWNEQLKQDEIRREKPKKLLIEYRWRLEHLDGYIAETEKSDNIDVKGADSIYMGRIGSGLNDYFQPSQPEFMNQSWGGIIGQLEAFGISEDATPAKHAVNALMNGPYLGLDSMKRGYFAPGVLEEQSRILHLYYDKASEKILDTSIWRVFSR